MQSNFVFSLEFFNFLFLTLMLLSHLFRSEGKAQANRLLTAALFCTAYASGVLLMLDSHLILQFPHLYRTANIFMYLGYPLGFLYVSRTLDQQQIGRKDLIHVLPAVVYLIDYFPFFTLPAETKKAIIESDISGNALYLYRQGWLLPSGFHFVFRTVLFSLYCVLAYIKLYKAYHSNPNFTRENRPLLGWLVAYTSFLAVNSIPFLGFVFLKLPYSLTHVANFLAATSGLLFAIYLFIRPDILYGIKGLWVEENKAVNKPTGMRIVTDEAPTPQDGGILLTLNPQPAISGNTTVTPLVISLQEEKEVVVEKKKVYLKEELVQRITRLIDTYMEAEKPFLQKRFSISDLSAATKVPSHQLSAYLNNFLGSSFSDFVNEKRISYLLNHVVHQPDWGMYTLEAIALQIGFNNRYTFLNAFKKFTGQTPSEYFKGKKMRD